MSDRIETVTTGVVESPASARLIAEIGREGGGLFIVPPVEFAPRETDESVRAVFDAIEDFEVIVIADVVAAEYFLELLAAAGLDAWALDHATVCTAGEAVADALRFVQAHADVIPPRVGDDEMLDAVRNYFGGSVEGAKMLVVAGADDELSALLAAHGADAALLAVYDTRSREFDLRRRAMLLGGAADAFVFAHPREIVALRKFANAPLARALAGCTVYATSEVVFQSLQEEGLRPLFYRRAGGDV